MPIYTYVVVDTGEKFDVLQKPGEAPHVYASDVDPDTVIDGSLPENPNRAILREPTSPGGFRGLPTPRFYS